MKNEIEKIKELLQNNSDLWLGPCNTDYPGTLIMIEGNDGAGKTTLANLLNTKLQLRGYDSHLVRTPGGTPLGEDIRAIVKHAKYDISPMAEAFLFQSQLAQCITEVILPCLNKGDIVVCDRLIFSTFAYQVCGRELDINFINMIQNKSLGGVWPDFGFLVKNPNRKPGNDDRIENAGKEFSARVGAFYDYILGINESAAKLMTPITVKPDPLKTLEEIWYYVETAIQKKHQPKI